jgi:hypothetical protein
MPPRFSPAQVFCYLRMGLVTGLIDKAALIAWADAEIVAAALPDARIIDLALSQNRSYSAIIWRLRDYQGPPIYDLALEALLARAGRCLAADPGRASDIALGLRLLDEEEYLPSLIRRPIQDLKTAISDWRCGQISAADLHAQLAGLLAPFRAYEALLDHLP